MDDLNHLLHRRQFLVGPRSYQPTPRWRTAALANGLVLSTHPDLPVARASDERSSISIIGYAVDPYRPERCTGEIADAIHASATSAREVLDATESLSGRWVLLRTTPEGSIVFSDPCGLRTIYFAKDRDGLWCGSQPEIIRKCTDLTFETGVDFLEFIGSSAFTASQGAWVGNTTAYSGCFRVLPNHYLDLRDGRTVRAFPVPAEQAMADADRVGTVVKLLQGSIDAMARRGRLMLAVTAGWDSRVLLAATKSLRDRIDYYVDRMGVLPDDHPDLIVPQAMAQRLKIPFEVHNSDQTPPGWFTTLLSENVTFARVLPKTRTIYHRCLASETRVNINGNGSEICRFPVYWGRKGRDRPGTVRRSEVTADLMAQLLSHPESVFVKQALHRWAGDLEAANWRGCHPLDLLYWEHRMGGWGAHYPAEQDIAIEEFSPFNNRRLISTMLSLPARERKAPDFPVYRELLERMWEETLEFSFNPAPEASVR